MTRSLIFAAAIWVTAGSASAQSTDWRRLAMGIPVVTGTASTIRGYDGANVIYGRTDSGPLNTLDLGPGLWINTGTLSFDGGTTIVSGNILNISQGQIINHSGGVVTFTDAVKHNGFEIRTDAGSRTIFSGTQSGAGPFTGLGTVEYRGEARPGNSPANVTYGGSVVFNPSSHLIMEIGGTQFGTEYDRLTVMGDVTLDGTLTVQLINGFIPQVGQSFMLIDNQGPNPIHGTFIGLPEGGFLTSGGAMFKATYVGGNGNDFVISPVPEPTWILGAIGIASGGWLWRRRAMTRRETTELANPQ